jgi:TPR repeat protein
MADLRTRLKAWLGDADAQIRLAVSYWPDDVAKRDPGRALYWARRAMHNGEENALAFMTSALKDSGHESESMEGIVMIWRQAAEAGDAGGQFSLGRAYECGDFGVPRDRDEALRWYTKAAIGGDEDAARAVARLCSAAGSDGAGKE